MRLHNRQVKAAFWDDPKLLRLHRDARTLFHGLWHLADDSGCLEYDTFAFKTFLFKSPIDDDMTIQRLEELTMQLIDVDLLVVYEAARRRCLFIRNFHKHQSLRSPAPPEVPLPPWVQWVAADAKQRSGTYAVQSPDDNRSESVDKPNGDRKETVRTPYGDHSEPKGDQACARNEPEPEPEPEEEVEEEPSISPPAGAVGRETKVGSADGAIGIYPGDFEMFWLAYPRKVEKRAAFTKWKAQLRKGASAAQLLQAAKNYAEECQRDGREEKFIKHGATFLGPTDAWKEHLDLRPAAEPGRPPAGRRTGYRDPAANGPIFDPDGPWKGA